MKKFELTPGKLYKTKNIPLHGHIKDNLYDWLLGELSQLKLLS